jgi:hypothetical protein
MIRTLPDREARAARRWRRIFVPLALITIEGVGRSVVFAQLLETRWSVSRQRRIWRTPS